MASNLRFIQFPHPGREHKPNRAGGKGWNTHDHNHARKFMELDGEWIGEDGCVRSGDLRAWGEWEAESHLIRKLVQPRQDSRYPHYLWRPFYTLKDNYKGLHNTDPFIFGERFLYSNCKQRSLPSLTRLERGSVIAFGSGMNIAGERKWALDTVFVVADSLAYTASGTRQALADAAPEAFLVVTGGPIIESGETSFRLYLGATQDNPVDGMYSYFPATPAQGDTGFPRPLIDLPSEYFNPGSWQSPKGVRSARTSEELQGIWNSLAIQVLEAGLVLGTHAALPERR